MQLRLKLAALTSATVLVGGIAVAVAGPAAAQTDTRLCVDSTKNGQQMCAEAYPTNGITINLAPNVDNGSPWNTPVIGKTGEISYSGNNLCITIDKTDGNITKLETCSGIASQEWSASEGGPTATTVFKNKYEPSECLNADPYSSPPALIGYECSSTSVNQDWYQFPA
jgi:hypothetical protein